MKDVFDDSYVEHVLDAYLVEDTEDEEPNFSNDYYVDMAKYAEMDEKEADNYCFGY